MKPFDEFDKSQEISQAILQENEKLNATSKIVWPHCAQSNVVSVIGKAAAHVQIIRLLNYIALNCSKIIKTQALNCSKIIKTQAQSFMYNFPVVVMKSSFGERHELWTHDGYIPNSLQPIHTACLAKPIAKAWANSNSTCQDS